MSALDVLRQIRKTRNQGGPEQKVVEWGNADYITEQGIENMNRRELRNHLEARDLATTGTRLELIERLRGSVADEQLRKFAYAETIETENMIQSDIEERGSVYVCGTNHKGQLGLGDLDPRRFFTVVPQLRGINVSFVSAGLEMCYALTEEHDVYVWGGGGYAKNGLNPIIKKKLNKSNTKINTLNNWLESQLITDLIGEECIMLSVGLSHTVAVGRGGDCFVWGDNAVGQLGLGNFVPHPTIAINNSFPAIQQVGCGANHTVALTKTGLVYSWGHSGNGRLGIGLAEKKSGGTSSADDVNSDVNFFPIPQLLKTIESIKQISCGADHTLAYGASGVWAWGNGSGGKLGLGDCKDRQDPCLIPRLKGKFVLQVVAGTWHSMAIVAYPPVMSGGWLHSWGAGLHGQLALGERQSAMMPELIEYFLTTHIMIRYVSAGSHHVAAITTDNELYTWGSNVNGCLGRKISERDVTYTPTPGLVSGFGCIIGRTGRGLIRHVSCGKEFTAVCTWPYSGPSYLVASKLMEEAKVREQETLLAKKAEQEFHDDNK